MVGKVTCQEGFGTMRNQKDRVMRNANVPFSSAGFLTLAF